jgi:hypothetical protein
MKEVGDREEVGYICCFAEVDHQCPWRLLLAEDRIHQCLPVAELADRQLRKLRMACRFAVAEETQSEEEDAVGSRRDDGCLNSEPLPF